MKKLLILLLSGCMLVTVAMAQDASAMQIYKAAKISRQGSEPVAAQHIRRRKRLKHRKTPLKHHLRHHRKHGRLVRKHR